MPSRLALGLAAVLLPVALACAPVQRVVLTPRPTPEPPIVSVLPGRVVVVEGQGPAVTDPIVPAYEGGLTVGISVVTARHDGQAGFVVRARLGQFDEVLVRTSGPYRGQRPIVVTDAVVFDVSADGPWSLRVEPIASGGSPAFSGTSDAVSRQFAPPPPSTWEVSHDGRGEFVVKLHCVGGSATLQERTGPVRATLPVEFSRGPCFWEVRADGTWSLTPSP